MEARKNANITSDQYYILLTNVTDTSFRKGFASQESVHIYIYICIYIYNINRVYIKLLESYILFENGS